MCKCASYKNSAIKIETIHEEVSKLPAPLKNQEDKCDIASIVYVNQKITDVARKKRTTISVTLNAMPNRKGKLSLSTKLRTLPRSVRR